MIPTADFVLLLASVTLVVCGITVLLSHYHNRHLRREVHRLEAERAEEARMLQLCRERTWEQSDENQTASDVEANALAAYNEQRHAEVAHRKTVILDKLTSVRSLQTSDVAELLDVARSTAFSYLNELEAELKIVQVGETGPDVRYRLPPDQMMSDT